MKTQHHNPKFLKQRRFFTILPLLIIPFLTAIFWVLNGGTSTAGEKDAPRYGLNQQLPDAQLNTKKAENKMSYYEHAQHDSLKLAEKIKGDPAYSVQGLETTDSRLIVNGSHQAGIKNPQDAERRMYQKLDALNAALNSPEPKSMKTLADNSINEKAGANADIERLQQMMQAMKSPQVEDAEMKQINSMLEKIISIQHPDAPNPQPNVLTATRYTKLYQTIPAVIAGDQKILQGSIVKVRLLDSVILNGVAVPKGQLLFGKAQLSNQRLNLHIENIRLDNAILPVDLVVFDKTDGLEGINVPEAITGDAIRSGSANAVQGLQLMPMDQTLSTQLAGAGISAAKGLFTRKVKRIKARLKDGHPLLLRDNSKK